METDIRKMEFKVFWDEESEGYVAMTSTYPSLSWIENNPAQALAGLVLMLETEGCKV